MKRTPARQTHVTGLSWAAFLWITAATHTHAASPASPDLMRSWPQWRGPVSAGVAPQSTPPLEWSESRNVRWKVTIPGKAHSSPIVAGDRVFVQTAVPVGEAQAPVFDRAPGTHDNVGVTHRHQFRVLALRRSDGGILWDRTVREAFPHEGGHATGSLASNSPTTDGERVYASFGSRGIYALDWEGRVVWERDLGRMDTLHAHGEGSSPVLFGDTLFVNWDHEGESFLFALDKRTGSTRWKVARDEKTSWSTPLVIPELNPPQVVVSATRRVRGYNATTGELIWECAGLTDNVVSSPVFSDGLLIAGNSYYQQAMMAVRLDGARGDVSATDHVAWRLNRMTPYVSSPLLYDGTLYFLRHNQNVLSRLDPATGRPKGEPLRLDAIRDFIFSSPVAAAGRMYVTARDGVTVVLAADRDNRVLAVNRLEDSFSATAALAGEELYLRGEQFLYCVAEGSKPERGTK